MAGPPAAHHGPANFSTPGASFFQFCRSVGNHSGQKGIIPLAMSELKDFLSQKTAQAAEFYVRDLEALTHEQLDKSPGGSARAGYDFTHEVVVVNKRIACRLRNEDPGPWPFGEGWAVCPDGERNKEHLAAQIKSSAQEIVDAIPGVPDEKFSEEFELNGSPTSFADMVGLASMHIMYHGAQLNYLQAMGGDLEMHWMD